MEMHHRLRRDPSWDPRGCNICGQMGHQAANCTNGTINWKQIYGEDEFRLKPPVYWSDLEKVINARKVDVKELEARAKQYAEARLQELGPAPEVLLQPQTMEVDVAATAAVEPVAAAAAAPATEEEPLPEGWAVAHDANNRPYYYHKTTQQTTWERPKPDTAVVLPAA